MYLDHVCKRDLITKKRTSYKHSRPGFSTPSPFEVSVKSSIVTVTDLGRDDDGLCPGPWDNLGQSRDTEVAGRHQQQVETGRNPLAKSQDI